VRSSEIGTWRCLNSKWFQQQRLLNLVAITPLESSKDHGGVEHLTLVCIELVILELRDYCLGLLSGANRQEFKRINMNMTNKINNDIYKYLDEFKEKTNELVK
jgi:hypothetical protein